MKRMLTASLAFSCLLYTALGAAQFRDKRDRAVSWDMIKYFSSRCHLIASNEHIVVDRINSLGARAASRSPLSVKECFKTYLSAINGSHSLYEHLCDEVTQDDASVDDNTLASQLLSYSHYGAGIRQTHADLNECLSLVPHRAGVRYMVPVSGVDPDGHLLKHAIDDIKVNDPFPATQEPVR